MDSADASPALPRALAGAASILERIAEDEAAAREERLRLTTDGLTGLEPDPAVRDRLRDGEQVVDMRAATKVERIVPGGSTHFAGRLHLTTQRLILTGAESLDLELTEVEELSLVGERLLVGLGRGLGLCFDISGPRVFRVRAAHAIAHAR